ncbi:hypothetical protein [Anaerotignum sp.]|uniref:hypothetical protein n=1 Tax=Anaerotignum sp. TaxID=2039241 RepID=UPI00271536FD|nr:hypothetical protein [Anaerotignum sp.]
MRYIDAEIAEKSLRQYADQKHANGEIELANGILKAVCKLKTLPAAELKARLSKAVELPCKLLCAPGDLVFEANINRNIMSVYEVTEIAIQQGFVSYRWKIVDGIYSRLTGFSDLDFGKTVFLTEAEAQAKLEEMKGGAEC